MKAKGERIGLIREEGERRRQPNLEGMLASLSLSNFLGTKNPPGKEFASSSFVFFFMPDFLSNHRFHGQIQIICKFITSILSILLLLSHTERRERENRNMEVSRIWRRNRELPTTGLTFENVRRVLVLLF